MGKWHSGMLDFINSYWPWGVAAIMVLAAARLASLCLSRNRMPYVRRKRLVTKSEFLFFQQLRAAVDEDWEIFAMVRIADLLKVESGARNYRSWLNKILAKHVDFVLCERDTLRVLVCIELDDPSHDRPDRQERDRFVNHAFKDAELPLLRIATAKTYDPARLRTMIKRAILSG